VVFYNLHSSVARAAATEKPTKPSKPISEYCDQSAIEKKQLRNKGDEK